MSRSKEPLVVQVSRESAADFLAAGRELGIPVVRRNREGDEGEGENMYIVRVYARSRRSLQTFVEKVKQVSEKREKVSSYESPQGTS